MKTKRSLLGFIVCILTISLLTSGGCDIEFSDNDDNGGGGGGGRTQSILRGTITEITPQRDRSGVLAQIIQDDQTTFPANNPTGANGFFRIDGDFNSSDGSSLRLEFLDESNDLLAARNITVFPDADVRLGNLTITNGNIDFDDGDGITVVFEGEITENLCSGDQGTIEVTANDNDTLVLVQVSSSTSIIDDDNNNSDIICEDLTGEVEVTGELLPGDSVEADVIQLQ